MNYCASKSKSCCTPENNAGFSSRASELMTPSHPVYSRHLYISAYVYIPPLAITGIFNLYLISLIMSQLHLPVLSLFYSFVLP